MKWEIEYYKTPGGQEVVRDFIDTLQISTQAKLARQLDLLERYGNELGMPYARMLGKGLMELRVRGTQEVRVFYAFITGGRIYLLHGFVKKTQNTPLKELSLARRRQQEVL